MANGYIAVAPDNTGKKLQTYENTVGGQDVHSEAVTLTDSLGAEITVIPVTGALTDTQLRASAVPISVATVPTHAVTQSGTWTVQPGNTANTTAWKVDGSAVTQPVSGTVALGAGSAVVGHVIADTGSTTAVTGNVTVVQGTATNLKVDASGVAVPVTDNSGSLTVDNAGTFAVQASIAAAQTLATVTTVGTVSTITNVVHVDDNGGSLTVDGTVTATPTGTYTTKETRAATPAQSSVANSASNVTVLAANANRLGATIFNDDTAGTGATLKLKLGATASSTSFTVAIAPQGYYEVPFGYTGIIDGIASAGTGNARITELT